MEEQYRSESERLLSVELERLYKKLSELEPGTKEYADVSKAVDSLERHKIEILRTYVDWDERYYRREMDADRNKDEKLHKWIDHSIEICGIVIPLLVWYGGFKLGLRAEKDDILVGNTVRGHVGKFNPFKKA